MNIKHIFKTIINKFRNKNIKELPMEDRYAEIVDTIEDLDLAKHFEEDMPNEVRDKINKYDKIKELYNFPLNTKISVNNSTEIVKSFFNEFDYDIGKKIGEIFKGSNGNIHMQIRKANDESEAGSVTNPSKLPVYVDIPVFGDLRDAYTMVHELTHTLDIKNKDLATRRILGEVAPQCMERMLDDFLKNIPDIEKKKYGISDDILEEDIETRRTTTFITRYRNVMSLNREHGNREMDIRYMLAQMYSSKFIQQYNNSETLLKFIKYVEDDDFENANKTFGIKIDKRYSVDRNLLINSCYNDVISEKEDISKEVEKAHVKSEKKEIERE